MEFAEAAQEGASGDDAAEGGACGGGSGERRQSGQAEEDLLKDLFDEVRRRPGHGGPPPAGWTSKGIAGSVARVLSELGARFEFLTLTERIIWAGGKITLAFVSILS